MAAEIIIGIILFFTIFFATPIIIVLLVWNIRYAWKLKHHKCVYCNRNMKYKGLRGAGESLHYLFHCEHCGAWDQIKHSDFFNNI